MKNFSSLLSCIMMTIAGTAQPTLQQNNGFQLNTSIQLFAEIEPSLAQGNSGPNQTWNFSSLMTANGSTEFNTVLTSSTPYAADFPDAELATENFDYSGNTIYNYFTNDNSLYTTWGYESAQLKLVYTNPRDILHYPFTYLNSFTDSYYGEIEGGFNAGVIEEMADGYGTLILPTGTFPNCLRVREVRRDTTDGDLIITISNDTSYKFYVMNYAEPLCQVNYHHSSNGFDIKEIYWQDVDPNSIPMVGQSESLQLFPNPCQDVLNIGNYAGEESAVLKITDALGRSIATQYQIQNHSIIVNTSLLPDGIYFLSIETKKGKKTCSFVKEMK